MLQALMAGVVSNKEQYMLQLPLQKNHHSIEKSCWSIQAHQKLLSTNNLKNHEKRLNNWATSLFLFSHKKSMKSDINKENYLCAPRIDTY